MATGKTDSIPKIFVYDGSPLMGIIESIRDGIIDGQIKTFEDLPPMKVQNEGQFWKDFNKPANFLKHGQKDSGDALDLAKINNEELLMRATAVFFEISNRLTPEIEAYYIFNNISGLPEEIKMQFANLTQSQKRKKCLGWLQKRRAKAARLQGRQ